MVELWIQVWEIIIFYIIHVSSHTGHVLMKRMTDGDVNASAYTYDYAHASSVRAQHKHGHGHVSVFSSDSFVSFSIKDEPG